MDIRLGDILSEGHILTDLRATSRWEAIDELVAHLAGMATIKPQDCDAISAAVKKRERSMSTGIGLGVGMPHASTDLIDHVVGALGRSKQRIDFDALDGQPVNLVLLLLIPQGQFRKHLHTVADISALLRNKELRQALEQAPDAGALLQIIRSRNSLQLVPQT
jgi:mannitol/fructose-specific phosphotransferase system IIA component (Ntr-type)